MLYPITIIPISFGLAGLAIGYSLVSFIHVLIAVSVVMILLNLLTGRKGSLQ